MSVREQLATTISGNIKVQNMLNKLYDSGFTAKAVVQYTGSLNDDNVKTFIQGGQTGIYVFILVVDGTLIQFEVKLSEIVK